MCSIRPNSAIQNNALENDLFKQRSWEYNIRIYLAETGGRNWKSVDLVDFRIKCAETSGWYQQVSQLIIITVVYRTVC